MHDGNDESGEVFDGLSQLHDVEGWVGGGEEAGGSDGGRGAGGNKRNESEGNDLRNAGDFQHSRHLEWETERGVT